MILNGISYSASEVLVCSCPIDSCYVLEARYTQPEYTPNISTFMDFYHMWRLVGCGRNMSYRNEYSPDSSCSTSCQWYFMIVNGISYSSRVIVVYSCPIDSHWVPEGRYTRPKYTQNIRNLMNIPQVSTLWLWNKCVIPD